jgi:hypothetical protein
MARNERRVLEGGPRTLPKHHHNSGDMVQFKPVQFLPLLLNPLDLFSDSNRTVNQTMPEGYVLEEQHTLHLLRTCIRADLIQRTA